MVSITSAQARSLGSLGLSALLRDYQTSRITLSVVPYSIAPSALADGLSSLICSFFIFIIIFVYSGKRKGHLWMIARAAIIKFLNTWHKLVGLVSGWGSHFVFRAFFFLYIYIYISPPPLIPLISTFADLKREGSSFLNTLLPSTYWSHRLYCGNDLIWVPSPKGGWI